MLSGASEPALAARLLAERSGAPVIVTLGSGGALLWADGAVEMVNAIPVSPIDTTGAGDALNGILAAELSRGVRLRDALRWAVAGASLKTMKAGAQAGLPSREEIAMGLSSADRA